MLPDIGSTTSEARRATVRTLVDAGATSTDAAVVHDPPRHIERRALSYLVGKGVVVRTPGGRYWVDEEAAGKWQRTMQMQNALVIGGIAAGIAAFAFSRYRRGKARDGEA